MISKENAKKWGAVFCRILPWAITVCIIVAGSLYYAKKDIQQTALLGDAVGGLATVLAFLWLIISVRSQQQELSLQREELVNQRKELTLQRQSLDLQTNELNRMGRCAALGQIATVIDSAKKTLARNGEEFLNHGNWLAKVMPSNDWTAVFNSTNADEVSRACMNHTRTVGPIVQFLRTYSLALRIYFESTGQEHGKHTDEFAFVWINGPHIPKIPYLAEYAGIAEKCCEILWTTEPGRKAIALAGIAAISITHDTVKFLKREEMLKNYAEMEEKGTLPPIMRTWKRMSDEIEAATPTGTTT